MSEATEKAIGIDQGAQPSRDPHVLKQAELLKIQVAISGCSFKDFLTLVSADDIDLSRNPDTGRDVQL